MDILADFIRTILVFGIPFLVVLTLVVFVHEMGHFLVGRWCGVGVDAFSIGFGREIIGYTDKRGTRWRLSMIPLGGYVKFHGDENAASVSDHEKIAAMSREEFGKSLAGKSVARRAAVVAAGPIANFLLTIAIFFFMFWLLGQQVAAPLAERIQPDGPAAAAGFEPGDRFVSIDGQPMNSFSDVQRAVSVAFDRELTVVIDRGGDETTLFVTPERREVTDQLGNVQRIGVIGIERSTTRDDLVTVEYSAPQALIKALQETWFILDRTIFFIVGLFQGTESADQLGGPIKIAEVSGKVAAFGILPLINLVALLSVSIGFINLLPVPMLDGGHLMFYAIEALRGKPLSPKVQDLGFRIGFAMVICLMIFVTWNDIANLLG